MRRVPDAPRQEDLGRPAQHLVDVDLLAEARQLRQQPGMGGQRRQRALDQQAVDAPAGQQT